MTANVRKKFPRLKEIYMIEKPIEPDAIMFKKNLMIPLLSRFTFKRKSTYLHYPSRERGKVQSVCLFDTSTQSQQLKRKERRQKTSPYLKTSMNSMPRWIQVLEGMSREIISFKGTNEKRKKGNHIHHIFPNPNNISLNKDLIGYDNGNLPFNKIHEVNDYVGILATKRKNHTDRRIHDSKVHRNVAISDFPLPLMKMVNKTDEKKISNLQRNLSWSKLKEPTVVAAVDCNDCDERREKDDKIEDLSYQSLTYQTPRILSSKNNSPAESINESAERRCVVKYSWQIIGTGTQALLQNHDDTEYWDGILVVPKKPYHNIYQDRNYAYEQDKLTKDYYIGTNGRNESCTQTVAEKESQADSVDCISKYSWQNLISLKRSHLRN